jgi:hypothetical protein
MIKSHLLYQLSYAANPVQEDLGGGDYVNRARACEEPGEVVSAEGIEPSTY